MIIVMVIFVNKCIRNCGTELLLYIDFFGTFHGCQMLNFYLIVVVVLRVLAFVCQVCPLCAAYPGGEPNHVIDDLAAHLMLEHRTSNNDLISFLFTPDSALQTAEN